MKVTNLNITDSDRHGTPQIGRATFDDGRTFDWFYPGVIQDVEILNRRGRIHSPRRTNAVGLALIEFTQTDTAYARRTRAIRERIKQRINFNVRYHVSESYHDILLAVTAEYLNGE